MEVAEIVLGSVGLQLADHVDPKFLEGEESFPTSFQMGDPSRAERDFGWRAQTRPKEFIPEELDKLYFKLKNPGKVVV